MGPFSAGVSLIGWKVFTSLAVFCAALWVRFNADLPLSKEAELLLSFDSLAYIYAGAISILGFFRAVLVPAAPLSTSSVELP